ncbi:MAG: [protein-PII] uridylyltransferase [Woeseia sp.]
MSTARAAAPAPATDPLLTALRSELGSHCNAAKARTALQQLGQALEQRFRDGEDTARLVRLRAALLDELIVSLWRLQGLDEQIALVAVGGYGRGELHPCSDVDLLLLVDKRPDDAQQQKISAFVTDLWDAGIELGQSVRTVKQCRSEALADITVATTLMEARRLSGPPALFEQMTAAVAPPDVWPSDKFFAAKVEEQQQRHHRYDDTAYKLEPNVKGSPGGLRDIQMIGWVAKRHFGATTLRELVAHGFLTDEQLGRLMAGQAFLWRVRFALHLLTGRREDRLLFDHQTNLARLLGFEDAAYTLAVEQMMQRYYRTVMELSRLNEMLLQLFEEAILLDPDAVPQPLNERFEVKNGYLQTKDDDVFSREPSALLEVFLLLQQNPEIRGVSALTVGLIKRHLYMIDETFRQDPRNHRLFLNILHAPEGVTHQLRRMNRYGVLGLYIPAFGRIVGRMQYDLFHAYTVDEHTLFVVSNLRRFALPRFDHEFPHCSQIMQSLDKPEVIYLAGLFHDIAKGRGGDHSELGAIDAQAFCLEHGMSDYDAKTVAWLVRSHLLLSMTAQKKDIGDPDVINEFAAEVRDKARLNYLYLLTVADVRGTNPKLWNSWKATLFRDLYNHTTRALRNGLENPVDRAEMARDKQDTAHAALSEIGVSEAAADQLWDTLMTEDYFLRYRGSEIAWHTSVLLQAKLDSEKGFLDVRRQPHGDGIEALLYTPRLKRTFAQTTSLLAEIGMTIVDARIVPLKNGFSLDTFVFMELDSRTEVDDARLRRIRNVLQQVLTTEDDHAKPVTRLASRRVRMFSTQIVLQFDEDIANRRTILEIVAPDRPGLLSTIGQAFIEFGIDIDTAKVLTIGERAEDVFYLVDESGKPLTAATCDRLRAHLLEKLSAQS